ncbi:MAG: serine/threonine protein kinase [Cryomorphaceae bacterium]|nr:serine/threonine protein kinase [Cryomorphaceae bacterium]
MEDFEDKIRKKLDNRFKVLHLLGKGGMASVYKAIQLGLERDVALKLIHPNLLYDNESLERFKLEARSAAKINHPNVITVFDQGKVDEIVFMALEFLEGYDLNDVIELIGSMPLEILLTWLIPTLEALEYVHSKGLIHRDIKGSNIFITNEGKPVLMDFGIASIKEMNSGLTVPGTVLGTPEFMSPEQANGEKIDQRSDIYSLGVLIYQCLAGKVPFKGDTPIATIVKLKTEDTPPLSDFNTSVPHGFERIIRKCLEKNKEERYQTAGEMLEDILSATGFVFDRNAGKKLINFIENTKNEKEAKDGFKTNLENANSLNELLNVLKSAPSNIPGVEEMEIKRALQYVQVEIKSREFVEGLRKSIINPNLDSLSSDEVFFKDTLKQKDKLSLMSQLLTAYLREQVKIFIDDFIPRVEKVDVLVSGFLNLKKNIELLLGELVQDDKKIINHQIQRLDSVVSSRFAELLPFSLKENQFTENAILQLSKNFPDVPLNGLNQQDWVLKVPDLVKQSLIAINSQDATKNKNPKSETISGKSIPETNSELKHSIEDPKPKIKNEEEFSAQESRSYIGRNDVSVMISNQLHQLIANDELINGILQNYINDEKKYGGVRRLLYMAYTPNVSDNVFYGLHNRMGSFKHAIMEVILAQFRDSYIMEEKELTASKFAETFLNNFIGKMGNTSHKNHWDEILKVYIQNNISESNNVFSAFKMIGHEAKVKAFSSNVFQLLVSEFAD